MDRTDNSQGAVLRFLNDPATHGTREVRRIETHANVVFLADDIALKVKRAVRFPFLDYSTLAKRKVACESELEVNRAFAPELYLRVVPITRAANGALALDGQGQAVEWAVEMRRFDEGRTLDHIAEAPGIDDDLARALAAMVSAMHEVAPVVEPSPWLAAMEGFIDQNAEALREDRELFDAVRAANLDGAVRAACARLRPLLLRRGKRGLTRRGHGDLHLANIVLLHDRPVPFDAIEFDPNVAAGDVLYDLAFLLMDLLNRGLSRAANIVLNGYCAASAAVDDLDGLAALPFFLSMRAAIRAKVTAARRQFSDPGRSSKLAEEAAGYFRLACGLISPRPPTLIAVGGLSGTGKSLLARALASFVGPAPGALTLRSDVERKKLFGVAETDKLPPTAYGTEAGIATYERLFRKAAIVAAARHSVIVDAVFAKPDERSRVAGVAAAANVAFRGLFLVADLKTRIERVGRRVGDASDADAEVARQQEALTLGRMEWTIIDASGSPAETLARARAALALA